jgi:hypothetical protein
MNYDSSEDANSHLIPLKLSDELKQEAIVTQFDTEEKIIEFYRILLFYFRTSSIELSHSNCYKMVTEGNFEVPEV